MLISNAFNIDLQAVDLGPQYQFLRAAENPLLEGISNQETCWLQNMQYSKPDKENRLMSDWLLRCESAENVLISEHSSCWREFYIDGACSERLRMPVVSHLLAGGGREHTAGMLILKHGNGRLILSQMPLPQDAGQDSARCCWSQILGNLGSKFDRTVLDGECVSAGSMRSAGYPTEFGYIYDPDDKLIDEILQAGCPTEFRIHNHALVHGFDWQVLQSDDGVFRIEEGCEPKRVIIAFQINAGRPRMIRYAQDGLPDPTEQTLCDLNGGGVVHPHINGHRFDALNLGENQQGVIPDVDLDMNWNTVILIWEPQANELKLSWRNRQRHPEVEFAFMFSNTKFLSGAVHQ
jgi:hypothetical protein